MFTYNILRSLKLQVLGQVNKRTVATEPRKICVHRNRRIAILYTLVHIVPLAGAISLLVLNFTRYFVGVGFSGSTTIQFLAKFHELLMQASIAECILHVIRYQAIHAFLPLGGISALLQTFHISYLWSLDFWSTMSSKRFKRRRKALFIATIPLSIVLSTIVGPSSAILMIPRQGNPKIVDIQYGRAAASLEEMFLKKVDKSNGLDLGSNVFRLYYRSPTLPGQETGITTFYQMEDSFTPRLGQVRLTSVSGRNEKSIPSHWATATISTRVIATDLEMYRELVSPKLPNTTVSIDFFRPVVTVGCMSIRRENLIGSHIPFIRDNGTPENSGFNLSELITENITEVNIHDDMSPFWVSPPDPMSASVIGIFPTLDSCEPTTVLLKAQNNTEIDCLVIKSCTISAFWETSQFTISSYEGPMFVQMDSVAETGTRRRLWQTPIMMDLSGIPTFNSPDITSGTFNDAEVTLATGFASALSEIPPWDTYHLDIDSSDRYSRFVFKTTQYGYGYNTSTTPVRLSISVIMIYCIVTISYITYILFTGSTSTAWNSPIEFLLLALKSKQARHLGYTSVGVDSVKTYREEVGIRVNDCDELELVFDRDPEVSKRSLTHVLPNQAY